MRIEQITFTRFVAAISIVIFHYGKDIFPFNINSISFIFKSAYLGVSYFFLLSGFIMIIAYGKKSNVNSLEYYKNRFARIYPIYFLAIVLLLSYRIFISGPIIWTDLFLNIACIQAWIPGKALSFNAPGWSLSVEFLFYAIFPFLFNRIYNNKKQLKKAIIPILLIFMVSQVCLTWFVHSDHYHKFPSKSHDFIYYFPLMHLNEFLIGNLAGLFFINIDKEKYRNYDVSIIFIFSLIVITLKYGLFGLIFHNGVLALLFIPFIILISLNTGIISTVFRKKTFVFLGEISFGVYILQFPVFIYSSYALNHLDIHNKFFIFYFSLTLLVILSVLSYLYIETPLRNSIKKVKTE